jgi:hypothetical protein
MSESPAMSAGNVVVLCTGRAAWAKRIGEAWGSVLEAVLATGRALIEAKEALRGEFLEMIEADLPFTASTAQRLMKIAVDGRIRDAVQQSLPVAWGTLPGWGRLGQRGRAMTSDSSDIVRLAELVDRLDVVVGCLERAVPKPQAAAAITATSPAPGSLDATIAAWLAACCVIDPTETSLTRDLYRSFVGFCASVPCYAGSEKRFALTLRARQFERWRGGGGRHGFIGLALRKGEDQKGVHTTHTLSGAAP